MLTKTVNIGVKFKKMSYSFGRIEITSLTKADTPPPSLAVCELYRGSHTSESSDVVMIAGLVT